MLKHKMGIFLSTFFVINASLAAAQSCAEPSLTDFKKDTLVSVNSSAPLDKAVHLAVVPDGRVFLAEMTTGNIQLYKPGATGVVNAGKVVTRVNNEDGLLGIAAPPDFNTSHFLYVLYSDPNTINRAHVLTRFTVVGDKLDAASAVEILKFARDPGARYHAAGGMVFDDKGNLIISTGDDTQPDGAPNDGYAAIYWKETIRDAQKSSSNSNDLRGKILRIHPEVTKQANNLYYTIPSGNLFPEGKAKTRPEIYTMGLRNPYRVTVDNKTGWIIWGEVGPDARGDDPNRGRAGHDELNVATKPGFFGWPYCNGNQFAYNDVDYSGANPVIGKKFDCAHPVNKSPNNTGIDSLPPSQAPIIWYCDANKTDFLRMGSGGATAMVGPMYRYDKNLQSSVKFPPQYDGRFMFWDWTRRVHYMLTLTSEGKLDQFHDFPTSDMNSDISAQYGADGSLYVLQYAVNGYAQDGCALYRITYKGLRDDACAPASVVSQQTIHSPNLFNVSTLFPGQRFIRMPAKATKLDVYNLQGKKVWAYSRQGETGEFNIFISPSLPSELLQLHFQ